MKRNAGQASLQDVLDRTPDLVEHFRNDVTSPWHEARMRLLGHFIPPEVSNWRDEQRAWRNTAMLFDLSHHMPELYLSGPGAHSLLKRISINDLSTLNPGRAKQLIACTPRGYIIGDCICYCHGPEEFELVSGMYVQDWVHYQAELLGLDVTITRENSTPFEPSGQRRRYRFQLEGPNAAAIFDEATGGSAPEIPFFRTARVKIADLDVLVLRHGMAGHMGAEFSGPYDQMEQFRAAILDVGEKYGLREGGTKSYFSATLESGWLPYPPPGIYSDEELRGFREWLSADSWEAQQMFGGSYVTPDIQDYYVTPWDLGYGHLLKFNHDFIGRGALEAMASEPKRTKVTLVWNAEDVIEVYRSQFGDRPRYKAIELPVAYYSYPHLDQVMSAQGRPIGISTHCGYTVNEAEMLSLAIIDEEYATPGTEVGVLWGEPDGGSRKPDVERDHVQFLIRATVAPVPYAAAARRKRAVPV